MRRCRIQVCACWWSPIICSFCHRSASPGSCAQSGTFPVILRGLCPRGCCGPVSRTGACPFGPSCSVMHTGAGRAAFRACTPAAEPRRCYEWCLHRIWLRALERGKLDHGSIHACLDMGKLAFSIVLLAVSAPDASYGSRRFPTCAPSWHLIKPSLPCRGDWLRAADLCVATPFEHYHRVGLPRP